MRCSTRFVTTALLLDQLRLRFDEVAAQSELINEGIAFNLSSLQAILAERTIGSWQALNQPVHDVQKNEDLMLLDTLTDTDMANPPDSYASSPTIVLQQNPADQYFSSNHYANGTTSGVMPNGTSNAFTPTDSIPPTPGSLAGRKRSRGDIHATDEAEEEQLDDGSVPTQTEGAIVKPRGKPVYGPGMTLVYPEDPGYAAIAAESQSGTWLEERAERNQFQLGHAMRPSISSRKSQRRDGGAAGADDLAQLVLPPQIREATTEPLIDEATRVLGISWTRMDSTEALRINQAAYSKWIQNHYPNLKNVVVWFENSAIPGYLVESGGTFYIFSHDLTEARLITSDQTQLIPRLKMLPALHLAAPGGHIRAETDAVTTNLNGVNGAYIQNGATKFSREVSILRGSTQTDAESRPPNGLCSVHEMELD